MQQSLDDDLDGEDGDDPARLWVAVLRESRSKWKLRLEFLEDHVGETYRWPSASRGRHEGNVSAHYVRRLAERLGYSAVVFAKNDYIYVKLLAS